MDLSEIKKLVSDRLLEVPEVSGIGIRAGALMVYLERDSESVRQKVEAVLQDAAPDTPFAYVVTGPFTPR